MQKKILLLLFFLITIDNFSQGLEVQNILESYFTGDTVTLTFNVSEKVDSIKYETNNNMYLITEKKTSNNISIVNGAKSYSYSITLNLIILKEGKFNFTPPSIWQNGNLTKSKEIILNIKSGKYSESEIILLRNKLENNSKYLIGTKRIIIEEVSGYIEFKTESGWDYQRKLSKKEFKKLSSL